MALFIQQNVNAKQDLARHIATLLLFFSSLKTLSAAIPEDVTCTGTLQQWHIPTKRDVQAAAVKDITFPKAQYGKTPKVIKMAG